jgi:hypothetical protein
VFSLMGSALGGTAKGPSNAAHRVGGPFDRGCRQTENTVKQGLAVPPTMSCDFAFAWGIVAAAIDYRRQFQYELLWHTRCFSRAKAIERRGTQYE